MGFWISMLIVNLIIPLTMIGFGRHYTKSSPKKINMVFGYRTTMSMKNKETWEFAHRHCGKVWLVVGLILLPISCVAMLFALGKDVNYIAIYICVVIGVQLVLLISSTIPTSVALNKTFDKNGNRI